MASMSVSGVVSGMDWESMIDSIIETASAPAQPKVNKKQNLTNKKSLLEEMKVTMNSLQSSLSPLKLPSTYKAKQIDIERLDSNSSYKGVLTATVNADAEVNVWDVKVNKLATAQINRSKQITSSTLSSTLNGLTSSMLYVNMGGQKIGINVNATDSLQSLKSRINTTLKTLDNPMAITASVVDNKLILKSDNTGLGTLTNTETINYNMTGVNKLSTMSISDDDVENVSISKGTKKYEIHKDYTIANGNEIRWKQYDRSNEVNIGGTAEVKYTMSADDVYEASWTYGGDEAKISGFTMTDNGTLSKRVKIVDADGNTYTYGEDFTIDKDGKVVWVEEEEESTTSEPDSYTVTYSKTTTETASASGTKSGAAATPTPYTVSYSKQLISPVSVTVGSSSFQRISSLPYAALGDIDGLTSTDYSSVTGTKYIVPDDESEFTLTDGTTEYVYGNDYIIRSAPNGGSVTDSIIAWYDNISSSATRYIYDYAGGAVLNENQRPTSGTLLFSYTHAYKSQNGISPEVLSVAGTDYENLVVTDSDGNTYTYGTDFTITDGEIEWLIKAGPNPDDDISSSDFANIKSLYNSSIGADEDTDLPTVTLLDADRVVRTYFNPADKSIFTMTATDADTGDTVSYEYGRDYVIRVNDSGNGYVFSWAVTGDKNKDGVIDIKDANTEVTTYTAAKGISTSGWKAAPSYDSPYSFSFSHDTTTTATGKVQKSATDKSLASVLDGVTVDSSDYATAITISDGTKTYTYGKDYTIDSSGNISWIEHVPEVSTLTEAPEYYIVSYSEPVDDVQFVSAKRTSPNYTNNITSLDFSDLETAYYDTFETDLPVMSASNRVVVDFRNTNNTIKIIDENDVEYTYGVDFIIRSSIDADPSDYDKGNPSIIWARKGDGSEDMQGNVQAYATLAGLDTSNAKSPATGTNFTLFIAGEKIYSTEDYYSEDEIIDMAADNPEKLTITSEDGSTTYKYGVEYTIKDGQIKWILASDTPPSTRPSTGTSYTLIYEAFDALTATGEYDGEESQEAAINVDAGYGNISGSKLSYEQILKDLSLTSSSDDEDIAEAFAENFTLTDEYGDTYTYGDDFTITQGTDTDSTTSEHKLMITWTDGGMTPSGEFTLTYTGRGSGGGEVLTTDGVTRSANDTINPASSDIMRALYSDFDVATEIRITDGTESYFKGVDFTVENDGSGNAVISWINDTPTPATADYATYFENATSITVTDSDGTEITGYTIEEGSSGEAVLTMDDDLILDEGSYTVKVVKNGYTKLYDLTSDGESMEITRRSAWQSQDNTSAGSYDIYVTGSNGKITTYTGTRTAGSYNFSIDTNTYPSASDFENGTTIITQGSKTFYEGIDFNITDDDNGRATIEWINDDDGGTEWYYPAPGSSYTVSYTDSNGNTTSRTAYRSSIDTLRMSDYGLTTAKGSISFQYGDDLAYKLDAEPDYEVDDDGEYVLDDDGNKIPIANTDGHAAIKTAYSVDVTTNSNGNFYFNWQTPTLTSRKDLPSYGDELTVEYEYDANTFTLSGEAADLLGLNDDVTEAQDAELVVDGETVYRASNYIGADYGNELIKGVTIQLKGVGEVTLDISHDAEKAVESIQTFVDTYNDLMTWMNTRMTESQVDKDTASTIDSDDFRMRWGLLHGSSLLRQTKSQMRNLTSQNFTFSFTQRKSSEEIYGTMGFNGLKATSTLRLRIGTKYVDVTIDPSDTLETIVAKINDDTKGGAMNDIYYDDNGNKLQTPLLKASVENDMLVINSTSGDEITMSGSAAMNALKMNYTYKGLYQIGIASTSEDYGKSGELEFDTDKFMSALEDNPDEVQALMLKFVEQFSSWTKSMLNSSATGETSGTLTREIENIQSQIDSINEYLENYQERLDRMEESLRSRYGSTETSLARLSQQANSIAAILNQLNGTAQGGGYGQASS